MPYQQTKTITIIKYIPLQQGLRQRYFRCYTVPMIIKYIPLQQGLRLRSSAICLRGV